MVLCLQLNLNSGHLSCSCETIDSSIALDYNWKAERVLKRTPSFKENFWENFLCCLLSDTLNKGYQEKLMYSTTERKN